MANKVAFTIMTKGRWEVKATINYILNAVAYINHSYVDLFLLVEEAEEENYRRALDGADEYIKFIVIPSTNAGYSKCRKILWDKFLGSKYEQVFFSDDDVVNFYNKVNDGKNQRTIGLDKIQEVIDYMRQSPRPLTGLAFRQKHNLCNAPFQDFGRISAFIMLNNTLLSKVDIDNLRFYFSNYDVEKFRLYSDMFMTTGFLANGLINNVCYTYAFGTANMAQNEVGGCFIDHKSQQPILCATEINRILGNKYSKVIDNKGRVEIRIQWKKLYKNYNTDKRYAIKGYHDESESTWFEKKTYSTPEEANEQIDKLPDFHAGEITYTIWDNFKNEETNDILPF